MTGGALFYAAQTAMNHAKNNYYQRNTVTFYEFYIF